MQFRRSFDIAGTLVHALQIRELLFPVWSAHPAGEAPKLMTTGPGVSSTKSDLGISIRDLYRLSIQQYHAIADDGILAEDDPVELLGGWLIRKMTRKPAHPVAVDLHRDAFASRLSAGWYVRTQAPITLPDGEPEPDVVLVRGDRRDYAQRHPGPGDVTLVVEVADTSIARDRGIKKQLYAQAGIAIYWIVNLVERQIEVYTEPTGSIDQPDYRRRRDYGPVDTIPVVLDGVEVGSLRVQDVLP
jgi:Uma2 family endonuclease